MVWKTFVSFCDTDFEGGVGKRAVSHIAQLLVENSSVCNVDPCKFMPCKHQRSTIKHGTVKLEGIQPPNLL